MKKYLLYAGMFLGSFLVVNVAMYFFLDMTQPEPVVEQLAEADSTAVQPEHLPSEPDEHAAEHKEVTHKPPEKESTPALDETSTETQPVIEVADHVEHEPKQEILANIVPHETTAEQPPEKVEPVSSESEPETGDPRELIKLAKVLEGMKPDEAAAIASRLQTEEIVMLIMRMKDRKAAKIMAALPVEKAAKVADRMSEIVSMGLAKL